MTKRWLFLFIAIMFTAPLHAAINSCENLNNTQWAGTLIPGRNSDPQQYVTLTLNTTNSVSSNISTQNISGQIGIRGQTYNLLNTSTCTNGANWVSLQLNAVNNQGTTVQINTGQMTLPFSFITIPFNGASFTRLNGTNTIIDSYNGNLMQQN